MRVRFPYPAQTEFICGLLWVPSKRNDRRLHLAEVRVEAPTGSTAYGGRTSAFHGFCQKREIGLNGLVKEMSSFWVMRV